MFRIPRAIFFSCCVVGMTALNAAGGEIAFVPVSASGGHTITGNEIHLANGGQRVFLEVFLSDWDPDGDGTPRLKAWQADVNSASFSGGIRGTLEYPQLACEAETDPNRYCRTQFGGICSLSGNACIDDFECALSPLEFCQGSVCAAPLLIGDFCGQGFIFEGRSDYVYLAVDDLPAVDLTVGKLRLASTVLAGENPADPHVPAYAGTVVLDVPIDAVGSFDVGFRPPPDSVLLGEDNQAMAGVTLTPARITVPCTSNADCNDGSSCTLDTCRTDGICRNREIYNIAFECCDPEVGAICPKAAGAAGDADGNGTVDLADIAQFQTCYGALSITAACASFDMFCDCDITLGDFAAVLDVLTGP